jgi:hypothetical protein
MITILILFINPNEIYSYLIEVIGWAGQIAASCIGWPRRAAPHQLAASARSIGQPHASKLLGGTWTSAQPYIV